MKTRAWMLAAVLVLLPLVVARAGDAVSADKQAACTKQGQQREIPEPANDAACDAKGALHGPRGATEDEPVEMTVGSPPMMSDDTGTPGPSHWEINFLMTADLAGGEREIDLPTIDANYGIGDTIELTVEVPYVFSSQQRAGSDGPDSALDTRGIGHSTFGVKYRFFDDQDTGLSLAVYPQVLTSVPDSEANSPDDDRTILILPLLVTREFSQASITANVGVEDSAGEHRYFASLGAGTRLTDNVALLAEVVGTNLNAADEKHVLFNLGATRKISDTQSIMGALGHDVYAGGDAREHLYLTLAYQKLFGR